MAHLLSSSQAFLRNPKACLLVRSVSPTASFLSSSSCNGITACFNLKFPAQLFSTQDTVSRKLSVTSRQSEYFQSPRFDPGTPSNSSYSPQSPNSATGSSPRFFVGHSIYKGKAALAIGPKAPEFAPLESGAFKISREGCLFLQFAPAAGVRQYDWQKKQVFSLSVSEIGTLISLGEKESCEFFHDPNIGKGDEGKVRKLLKVEPLPTGSGHFFNLSVQNKLTNVDESIYIPITKAEFAVLRTAFNYILPFLMGWHAFAGSVKSEDTGRGVNASPRASLDHEWSR